MCIAKMVKKMISARGIFLFLRRANGATISRSRNTGNVKNANAAFRARQWMIMSKLLIVLWSAVNLFLSSNVSVQVRRLVRRNLQRLVGIYVLAVHALDLSEIVAARSMLFAGGWWRINFTCGSPYILIPTSAFTLGAPCAP